MYDIFLSYCILMTSIYKQKIFYKNLNIQELSFHIQVGDIALEEQSAIFEEKNHVICSLHIFTSF